MSYLGDASIGESTNIGAGTVTCNFDGVDKHRTEIGANVFIGSDSMLVAPLTIGDGAITGAGSVVTKDVAPGMTVVGIPARPIRRRDAPANSHQPVEKGE
jgi:bifunctional UDP-N-acetylglucosamine pyrophosphorylase/glucosamine-1-phosphate N-acetyltransferase